MKSAESFVRKRKKDFLYDRRLPHIRWNFEPSEVGEQHFHDLKGLYNFFIIYRNPEIILNRTLEQFSEIEFHPVLELVEKIEGDIPGTVNKYLFSSYQTDKKLENLTFDFTNLPIVRDSNLTNKYRKRGYVERYLMKFIDE